LFFVTGHYVPLLSLAVAQYSRANAGSGFNLQGMAVGERTIPWRTLSLVQWCGSVSNQHSNMFATAVGDM